MLVTTRPRVELTRPPFVLAGTRVEVEKWIESAERLEDRTVAVDIETTGLSPINDRIVMVQLGHHRLPPLLADARWYMEQSELGEALRSLLENPEWLKVLHNAQFDMAFIQHHYGIRVNRHFDTMLAEKLLTMGRLPERNTLADVSLKYLGVEMDKSVRLDFTTLGDDELSESQMRYAARDVEVLGPIMRRQVELLQEEGLVDVMRLELALTQPLIDAHLHGVLVNKEKWGEYLVEFQADADAKEVELLKEMQPYHDEYQAHRYKLMLADYTEEYARCQALKDLRNAEAAQVKAAALASGLDRGEAQRAMNAWKAQNPSPKAPARVYSLVGVPLNLGSGDQLGGALEAMGVPMTTKKDTGSYETGKEHLTLFSEDYPICAAVLEYREVSKLLDSFGENVLELVDDYGRLHPRFNQMVRSGRMSCSSPNIQQIPGGSLGGKLRECFIAAPGFKLLDFDYSNIELRILAHLSQDKGMIRAFQEGLDLHTQTATSMFDGDYTEVKSMLDFADTAPEEMTSQDWDFVHKWKGLRKIAKIINFAIPYGQSPAGFARTLNITYDEADAYVKAYYEANPGVKRWLDRNKRFCMARGYADTLFGRKRYFNRTPPPEKEDDPEGFALWKRMQKAMERVANNHPIQGLSADITKIAVVRVYKALAETDYYAKMIMFVHDEIVLECADEHVAEVMELVEREMKAAAEYFITAVPIEVGSKADTYWAH